MTNLALRYRATEHWTAYLAVDNVFETHNALYVQTPFSITPTVYGGYAYPSDYTRLWRFGVETRF
jgi:outer membrane receptor protein involved in Fe transport